MTYIFQLLLLVLWACQSACDTCVSSLESTNISSNFTESNRDRNAFNFFQGDNGTMAQLSVSDGILYMSAGNAQSRWTTTLASNCDSAVLRDFHFIQITLDGQAVIPARMNVTVIRSCLSKAEYTVAKTDFYRDEGAVPVTKTAQIPLAYEGISEIALSDIQPLSSTFGLVLLSLVTVHASCKIEPHQKTAANQGFVWKNGSTLMLFDKPLRFIAFHSTDFIWSQDPRVVEDAVKTFSIIGNGSSLLTKSSGMIEICLSCSMTAPRSYNERRLQQYDFFIATLAKYNIRVFMSFINLNSVIEFSNFYSCPGGLNGFFLDRVCIDEFKDIITVLINRVNRVTGQRYGDDPTIAGWQLGRDLSDTLTFEFLPISWISEISSHVKSLAPFHLIMDGGTLSDQKLYWPLQMLAIPTVDIFGHNYNFGSNLDLKSPSRYYLPSSMCQKGSFMANVFKKVFVISEIYATKYSNGTNLVLFKDAVENCIYQPHRRVGNDSALVSGMFVYSLLHRRVGAPFYATRGLYYPGFNGAVDDGKALLEYVRDQVHTLKYRIELANSSISVSRYILPRLESPIITNIQYNEESKVVTLAYFGSIGATHYSLSRGITFWLDNVSDPTLADYKVIEPRVLEMTENPITDVLTKEIGAIASCPYRVFYRLLAESTEGSLDSPPAYKWLDINAQREYNATNCTYHPVPKTSSTTATEFGMGKQEREQPISVTLAAIIAATCVFVVVGAGFFFWNNRQLLKLRQGGKLRLKKDGVKKQGSKYGMTANFTETLSIGVSNRHVISVPGDMMMNIDADMALMGEVQGEGLTSSIVSGRFKSRHWLEKYGKESQIAIKIYKSPFHRDGSILNGFPAAFASEVDTNFLFEVAVMASLPKSPFLMQMLGFCNHEKIFFGETRLVRAIVMKLYPCTLKDLIYNDEFSFTHETYLKVFHDTACGLMQLHESGILHLDFKPRNILMEIGTSDGAFYHDDQGYVVRPMHTFNCVISDFGFANFIKEFEDDGANGNQDSGVKDASNRGARKLVAGLKEPTQAGLTVRYAAPELFDQMNDLSKRFDSQNDTKLDVFSWAMSMYELLSHHKPWKELEEISEIEAAIRMGERPKFPTAAHGHKIPFCQDLIKEAWKQLPKERPNMSQIFKQINERAGEKETIN